MQASVPLLEPGDPGGLPLASSLDRSQTKGSLLKLLPQAEFTWSEGTLFLCNVQPQYHLAGQVELHFGIAEMGPGPYGEIMSTPLQFDLEPYDRACVVHRPLPSLSNSLLEVWENWPEIFKTESVGSSWSLVASQKQRAVIGERG